MDKEREKSIANCNDEDRGDIQSMNTRFKDKDKVFELPISEESCKWISIYPCCSIAPCVLGIKHIMTN